MAARAGLGTWRLRLVRILFVEGELGGYVLMVCAWCRARWCLLSIQGGWNGNGNGGSGMEYEQVILILICTAVKNDGMTA